MFFDDVSVPAANLIGEEGKGFKYILSGMNAERILIASECIGDAKWFIKTASKYCAGNERFSGGLLVKTKAYNSRLLKPMRVCVQQNWWFKTPRRNTNLARIAGLRPIWPRCSLLKQAGRQAKHVSRLLADLDFAAEYDVERKFRETRLYQVAPHFHQSDTFIHFGACARPAKVILMDKPEDWVGKEEEHRALLTQELVNKYRATIERSLIGGGGSVPKEVVPLGLHWCLCQPIVPTSDLASDGHLEKGKFLPPVPLPRRMFAGSTVQFNAPLTIGAEITRKSRIASVAKKTGSTGELYFVKIEQSLSR